VFPLKRLEFYCLSDQHGLYPLRGIVIH